MDYYQLKIMCAALLVSTLIAFGLLCYSTYHIKDKTLELSPIIAIVLFLVQTVLIGNSLIDAWNEYKKTPTQYI